MAYGVADGTGSSFHGLATKVDITKGFDVLVYFLTPKLDIVLQEFNAH